MSLKGLVFVVFFCTSLCEASITLSISELMNPVISSCNSVGGRFDYFQGCVCQDSTQVYRNFNSRPECIKLDAAPGAEICNSLIGDTCEIKTDLIVSDLRLGVTVSSNTVSQEKAEFLAEILRGTDSYFSYWHPHSLATLNTDITYNLKKTPFHESISESINITRSLGLFPHLLKNTLDGKSFRVYDQSISYYAPDLWSYLDLIGLNKAPITFGMAIPELKSDASNSKQKLAYDAFRLLLDSEGIFFERLKEVNGWSIELGRGNNCNDICYAKYPLGDIEDEQKNTFRVALHHEILHGMLHKRFLVATSNRGNVSEQTIIQLAPNLYPSMIVNSDIQLGDSGVARKIDYFDKNGGILSEGKIDMVLTKDSVEYSSGKRSSVSMKDTLQNPTILLCDGSQSTDYKEIEMNLDGAIMFGSEKSFYGWHKPSGETLHDFMLALYAVFLNVPMLPENGHLSATAKVSREMVNNLKILPLGVSGCWDRFDSWKYVTTDQHKVKTIAIPLGIDYSNSSNDCDQELLNKIKSDEGKKLLWVVSAGNEALKNPKGTACFAKEFLPNVMIIGASIGPSSLLASYSNHGEHYADLLANGEAVRFDGSFTRGTSFSAPRVAAIAAKIAHDFPTLSPEKIKMAILLGAKQSEQLKTVTRSGGYLDFDVYPSFVPNPTTNSSQPSSLQKAISCINKDQSVNLKNSFGNCLENSDPVISAKAAHLKVQYGL